MDSKLHETNDNELNIVSKESSEDLYNADTQSGQQSLLFKQINPKFIKLLCPDGSEYISMESLKSMIKTALGARFSDDEISIALNDLGFPNNEPIHYGVFLNLISRPLTSALAHLDDSFGEWLSTEDWQEAMSRIGIELSKDEIELAVEQTKKRILENTKGLSTVNSGLVDANDSLPDHGDLTKEDKPKLSGTTDDEETDDDYLDVSDEFVAPD